MQKEGSRRFANAKRRVTLVPYQCHMIAHVGLKSLKRAICIHRHTSLVNGWTDAKSANSSKQGGITTAHYNFS